MSVYFHPITEAWRKGQYVRAHALLDRALADQEVDIKLWKFLAQSWQRTPWLIPYEVLISNLDQGRDVEYYSIRILYYLKLHSWDYPVKGTRSFESPLLNDEQEASIIAAGFNCTCLNSLNVYLEVCWNFTQLADVAALFDRFALRVMEKRVYPRAVVKKYLDNTSLMFIHSWPKHDDKTMYEIARFYILAFKVTYFTTRRFLEHRGELLAFIGKYPVSTSLYVSTLGEIRDAGEIGWPNWLHGIYSIVTSSNAKFVMSQIKARDFEHIIWLYSRACVRVPLAGVIFWCHVQYLPHLPLPDAWWKESRSWDPVRWSKFLSRVKSTAPANGIVRHQICQLNLCDKRGCPDVYGPRSFLLAALMSRMRKTSKQAAISNGVYQVFSLVASYDFCLSGHPRAPQT